MMVIGLLIGGILVGRDLIHAAEIRSQISQFEVYKSSTRTFEGKYNALPGDLLKTEADALGFPRNTGCNSGGYNECGNGDDIVRSIEPRWGTNYQHGEPHLFWLDLMQAGFITDKITASYNYGDSPASSTGRFPIAKLGSDKLIYVTSGGVDPSYTPTTYIGTNTKLYFTLAGTQSPSIPFFFSNPTIKVADAYNIDTKIDDGMPQSGKVTAMYYGFMPAYGSAQIWVGASYTFGSQYWGTATTAAVTASPTTCYDNQNSAGKPQQYSMGQNGGEGANCAISVEY